MIIQNVWLSINKLCNDALHFLFLFCIYYFLMLILCSMKHNLDILLNLTMDTLTSIFLSVKHSKFAD